MINRWFKIIKDRFFSNHYSKFKNISNDLFVLDFDPLWCEYFCRIRINISDSARPLVCTEKLSSKSEQKSRNIGPCRLVFYILERDKLYLLNIVQYVFVIFSLFIFVRHGEGELLLMRAPDVVMRGPPIWYTIVLTPPTSQVRPSTARKIYLKSE